MAAEPIRAGNVLTNVIDSDTGELVTYTKVTNYYDGTPMTNAKTDGKIYRKLGTEYFLKNLGEYGKSYLEKNTIAELRAITTTEVLLLRMGFYLGVTVNGYYAKGDTPAPIKYILSASASTDDGGSIIVSTSGVKFQYNFIGDVDVTYYGLKKGDNAAAENNSIQLNRLADYCRANTVNILVPSTKEPFIFSKSLYVGAGDGTQPFAIKGTGRLKSRFTFNLDEPFPCLDYGNGKRCTLDNMEIRTLQTSQHSVVIFVYETLAAGCNLWNIQNTLVQDLGGVSKGAVAGLSADQMIFQNAEIDARSSSTQFGVYNSFDNTYGLTSKKNTGTLTGFGGDLTYITFTTTQIVASKGFAVNIEYYSTVNFLDCYFGDIGNFGGCTAFVRLASKNRNTSPVMIGCRSETHSNGTAIDIIYVEDVIYNPVITGTFTGRSTSAMIANGGIFGGTINATSPTMFNNAGVMRSVTFTNHSGSNALGTVSADSKANSCDLTFNGRFGTQADLRAAFGNIKGFKFNNSGWSTNAFESINKNYVVGSEFSPTNIQLSSNFGFNLVSNPAYTAGAGFQRLVNKTLKPSFLKNQTGYDGRYVDINFTGDILVNTTTQLRIEIAQGANVTATPAFPLLTANNNGSYEGVLRIFSNGSSNDLLAYGYFNFLNTDGTTKSSRRSYINLNSSGISGLENAADITIALAVSADINNPIIRSFNTISQG